MQKHRCATPLEGPGTSKRPGTSLKGTGYVTLLAVAASVWPVWLWYFHRTIDGADEPWGTIPLLIILVALCQQAIRSGGRTTNEGEHPQWAGDTMATAVPLGLYCLTFHVVPPLVHGLLGVTALSVPTSRILRNQRFDLAAWGLLTLSLPIVSSMQFYAGYPMRVVVARGAGILLSMSGTGVRTAGAALQWGDCFVDVDGPCSGIKALWTGALLVCLLAYSKRLRWLQTALFSVAALGVILLGNIFRAAALFHLEIGVLPFSQPWLHTGIGLVAFGTIGFAIWGLAHLFPPDGAERKPCPESKLSRLGADNRSDLFSQKTGRGLIERFGKIGIPSTKSTKIMTGVLAGLCLTGALLPLSTPSHETSSKADVTWPETFEGHPLTHVGLQIPFGDSFPGSIAQFSDGTRQILFKSVSRPSRLVHPSADCYRGSGWRIHPAPLHIDSEGRRWSVFGASRKNKKIKVREIVTDSEGNSWSTVSAWYWSAILNRTHPPWLVTVVATAEE